MKSYLTLVFILSMVVGERLQAQPKTSLVGLNFTTETSSGAFRPIAGLVFERQMTRRSGIETGLYYRNFVRYGSITYTDLVPAQTYSWTIAEQYISLPVVFKFYSRIVNVSAGTVLDFYAGWRQRHSASSIKLEGYDVKPGFFVGFLTKVGKTIPVSERFVLEPEIRFHPILRFNTYRTGIGTSGKCRL